MSSSPSDGELDEAILYLARSDVEALLSSVDPLAVVSEAFRLHALGRVTLPAESHMRWTTPDGFAARSLNMTSLVLADDVVAGTKIINACHGNAARRLPRASGLTVLFDAYSGRPYLVAEAALISAVRTAAVSLLSAVLMARYPVRTLGILGAGTIAHAHAELFASRLTGLVSVRLYDEDHERAVALACGLEHDGATRPLVIEVVADPRRAVRGVDVCVTCTTTRAAYIPYGWLRAPNRR